jgi:hypothetical protein
MDIAEIKRKARSAASKLRSVAHEQLKDSAGEALAARGLPAELGAAKGIVSASSPTRAKSAPCRSWVNCSTKAGEHACQW